LFFQVTGGKGEGKDYGVNNIKRRTEWDGDPSENQEPENMVGYRGLGTLLKSIKAFV